VAVVPVFFSTIKTTSVLAAFFYRLSFQNAKTTLTEFRIQDTFGVLTFIKSLSDFKE
jgi:hypothetical protein